MKNILLCLLLMIAWGGYGQSSIGMNKDKYQKDKREGKLSEPVQTLRQKNYPVPYNLRTPRVELKGSSIAKVTETSVTRSALAQTAAAQLPNCAPIENPAGDPSYSTLPRDDDGSSSLIVLPFTFRMYGSDYKQLYVNENGNITFNQAERTYTSTGFPSEFVMVAPFWSDVDTEHDPSSGVVSYKVEAKRVTVIWYQVAYFSNGQAMTVKRYNTFKLIISDGNDPLIGLGNNVGFYYGDMQWTTGTASGGTNGFGGTAATVGTNKGGGSCFFYQLGRFNAPGKEYQNAYTPGGVDYLDNQCYFFDVSQIRNVGVDFTYQKSICATSFVSQVNNPQNCLIKGQQWNFGDGSSSTEANPTHAFPSPGTYSVSLTIQYSCGACIDSSRTVRKQVQVLGKDDLLKDTLINVVTSFQDQVLQTTASTFSDAWPLSYENANLNQVNSYLNGSQGVWRNEGVYVYQVPRKASDPVQTATDGTFPLEQFNWPHADLNAIPHWVKAETKTQYSPFSYELENRDALGVYSAALYDYGGHLPSATGVNTRYAEMAFTSFEYLEGKASGNWLLGHDPLPLYSLYPVQMGLRNTAVVRASTTQLENVTAVDIQARGFGFLSRPHNYLQGVEIICKQPHPDNPGWTVVVFKRAPFPGLWTGNIQVKNQTGTAVNPDIDLSFAHAGRSSLKVSASKALEQPLLRLEKNKPYAVSAWVSVRNTHVLTPKLADNLGIIITFKDRQGNAINSITLSPAGPVVEGWQQVRGSFSCPDEKARLEITFLPGSTGTAWYDDLRLHPQQGNMKSYVYDLKDYRLRAILDEENFASFFYYDTEGNLTITKKETTEGIKTLTENVSYLKQNANP